MARKRNLKFLGILIGVILITCIIQNWNVMKGERVYLCRSDQLSTWTQRREEIPVFSPTEHTDHENQVGMKFFKGDWRIKSRLFPVLTNQTRYLTIGIPTIRREKGSYFLKTIGSLVNCSSEDDRKDVFIVVLLADFDQQWSASVSQQLSHLYPSMISSGTLQVIHAPKEFYPPLDNLKHTYNDTIPRRKWRSKQNADYAFLFMYSQPMSKYYMQLEDDVYTIPNYMKSIRKSIENFGQPWICLEFSELGFIGKTFHNEHLEKLSEMTLLFYEEQPVDFTFLYFNILMLQFRRNIIRPSLFQHVGIMSSLPGKIQPLKDKYFDVIYKEFKGENPPADVYTSIQYAPEFPPHLSYSLEDGYFWSIKSPEKGDSFTVVFKVPQQLSRVSIKSGSKEHPSDMFVSARLDASLTFVEVKDNSPVCLNDIFLSEFVNGSVNVNDVDKKVGGGFKVHCLRITVTENQSFWLIVKEIAVFLKKN